MGPRLLAALVAVVAAIPVTARADGMYIPQPSALSLEMTAQRGVLLVGPDGLEIILQSGYLGAAEDFGWIVPLPSRPVVEEGSAELLDEIDRLTAPQFFNSRCFVPCPSPGGDADVDAGPDIDRPDDSVIEWEQGTVGELEYSIVSGTDGGALVSWLEDNGFVTVPGLEAMLSTYAAEEAFFFAARVMPGAELAGGVTPVRLALGPVVEPRFPMRITALSPVETVRVVLWVFASAPHVPRNYQYDVVEGRDYSVDSYLDELDRLFEARDHGGFVAQFSGRLDDWRLEMRGERMSMELRELVPFEPYVTRFVAELAPSAMVDDVAFEPVERLEVGNEFRIPCPNGVVYEQCEDDPELFGAGGGATCRVAGGDEQSDLAAAIVGLVLLGLTVGRALRGRRPR